MKPVEKGLFIGGFRSHGQAKPDLIDRLGPFCSYCEAPGLPTQLHVEHIYPEAKSAHPGRARNWRNFLLACATCNTYKRHYLGDGRQLKLLTKLLWPHVDNTIRAFNYFPDGRVTVRANLAPAISASASELISMSGLLKSPAAGSDYEDIGIAYDGLTRRAEAWGMAENALVAYAENPTAAQLRTIQDLCKKAGHFSVWMEVFQSLPQVRAALIAECKAATACFDPITTQPLQRGRA